jgi:hypothetical protein
MQTGLEDQLGLYQKRIPIFTRSVKGRFRRFKTSVLVLAYAIYFLLPWLPWSRLDAPAQAVLFDLPGRRFLIFGLTVYPQDVIWLALLLFIAAILLFFVTGLVGRAFWLLLFQTLWTDFFMDRALIRAAPRGALNQPWLRVLGQAYMLWMDVVDLQCSAVCAQMVDFFSGGALCCRDNFPSLMGAARDARADHLCLPDASSVMYEPDAGVRTTRGAVAPGRALRAPASVH